MIGGTARIGLARHAQTIMGGVLEECCNARGLRKRNTSCSYSKNCRPRHRCVVRDDGEAPDSRRRQSNGNVDGIADGALLVEEATLFENRSHIPRNKSACLSPLVT